MLFTPVKIGPITLRNRSIRAAAFEGMCQNHQVTPELINYHEQVAKGGIGMTTVAYAAVQKSGLSFPHQLQIKEAILPDLAILTNKVHLHNAKASIQLGHCGNMAKHNVIGSRPISASTHINMYAPSFARKMSQKDINETIKAFGNSVRLVKKAGFDAVEIHAGHGYLISQFLSPYINKRKDEYGGVLQNRMRFMEQVMHEVMDAANNDIAVLVKMNMTDGFEGGITLNESLEIAKKLEKMHVHALILSSGFVSKAPMEVMRGSMPIKTLAKHAGNIIMSGFIRGFAKLMVPSVPFKETYFLENAKKFRASLKLPLVYVGGILSKENIDNVLNENFDAVALARVLIKDPDFVNKLRLEEYKKSSCDTCNHCIAVMYNGPFECIQNL
jgi:2,4-dienoyl-CoA reductase-like NADH-dependent reductase (Old Yellow Enzyme family)